MKFIETESIELKERLNDSFAREVVSFLNTHDGTIYIGITDDGEVIGVKDVDETLQSISNIIVDGINPSCKNFVKPMAILEEGKLIVKVEVTKGTSLYYIKSKGLSESGCFIRVGTSCRGLNDAEISEKYDNLHSNVGPMLVERESSRKDLTFTILRNYLAKKRIHINEENFYDNFNLLAPSGKFNKMAELLADENMESIKVAIFKGKNKAHFLKRNEYGNTCLLEALTQVKNYCVALNDTYVDLSVRPRREKRMFDIDAFNEAWVNACVHNKWVEGIPPAVYWFDDRLEIISYGGIPKGLSKEAFLSGQSKPVNPELMKIFLQCGIVEQSGHGVPIVVEKYGKDAYKFDESAITVTIPFDKTGFEKTQLRIDANKIFREASKYGNIGREIENINTPNENIRREIENINASYENINFILEEYGNLTPIDLIYKLLVENNRYTRFDLMHITGFSRSKVDRIIKQLKSIGKIKGKTSNKNGEWIIN